MKFNIPEEPVDLFEVPYWRADTDGGARWYISKRKAVYHLGPRPHHEASKLSGATYPATEQDRGAPWKDHWAIMEYSSSSDSWSCTGRCEGWDAIKRWEEADLIFSSFDAAREFVKDRITKEITYKLESIDRLHDHLEKLEKAVDTHHGW